MYPMDPCRALLTAVLVVLVVMMICRFNLGCSERFASKRARQITDTASELFTRTGSDSYSAYKKAVPGADPVQFSDVRGLWLNGKLTPQNVDGVL